MNRSDNENNCISREKGKGGFGKVCLVEHNGKLVARKEILNPNINTERKFNDAINEINMLLNLNHKNVIEFIGYYIDKDKYLVYIYTKYYEKGDLWKIIYEKKKKNEDFTLDEIFSFMKDLVEGLKYIHSKGIIHRDLKPGNILIEKDKDKMILKVSDFGLAILRHRIDIELNGTINYIAPELWKEKLPPYSTASDIFSLGCILYELYTLRMAFEGNTTEEVKEKIIHSTYLDFERINGERIFEIEELINRMLEKDPDRRINIYQTERIVEFLSQQRATKLSQQTLAPSLDNVNYKSNNYSSTSSWMYYNTGSKYDSLTVNFYLKGGYIGSKTLKEICGMNDEEFNCFWKEDYRKILFPAINQENPPFSLDDWILFKSNIVIILPSLNRIINLLLKRIQITNKCKEREECYLDEMIFNIYSDKNNKEIINISSKYLCLCEEGIEYIFEVLKLINPTKIGFSNYGITIPNQNQLSFGSYFYQLSNLQELDLSYLDIASKFLESFVESIPMTKLKSVNLQHNRIGYEGLKLMLPYLHLLINKRNELNLREMRLNDESIKILTTKLYKYPNLERIDIKQNNFICSEGLKSLFSKFPISNIKFDFDITRHIELLIDKDIPVLIKYIKKGNVFNLSNINIDDDFFNSFISLRLNELKAIEYLDLSNNNLTDKSAEILINHLSSFEKLCRINLNENNIRMKGLKSICSKSLEDEKYPFIELKCLLWTNEELKYYLKYCIKKKRNDYRKYDFSSLNVKDSHVLYIKQIDYNEIDLSNNKITSKGLKELVNTLPKNECSITICNNPIGDEGIEIICENLDIFINDNLSLNLENIGMSKKKLKKLIDRLKDYKPLDKINLSGIISDEKELRLMKENKGIFYDLVELKISLKENIDKLELNRFRNFFSTIKTINVDKVNEGIKRWMVIFSFVLFYLLLLLVA